MFVCATYIAHLSLLQSCLKDNRTKGHIRVQIIFIVLFYANDCRKRQLDKGMDYNHASELKHFFSQKTQVGSKIRTHINRRDIWTYYHYSHHNRDCTNITQMLRFECFPFKILLQHIKMCGGK